MTKINNEPVKLITDVCLIYSDKALLVKYPDTANYDHQTGWFLPDDEVKYGEHPEDAALRILKTQLGYITGNLSLSHIESFTGMDGAWHLVFHYYQQSDSQPQLLPSKDISAHQWFHLSELPSESDIAHKGWAKNTINKIKHSLYR